MRFLGATGSVTYKTRVIGICYLCLFGLEWHWGVRVFQLPFLWRGRYLYFLQRLLLGACRNCFLPLNPGVLHLARCLWVLFEAFCAFFTAGCETPKWIAVANSPFYLEFLRIRVLALAMIRRIHQHKIRAGHIYRCFGNQ